MTSIRKAKKLGIYKKPKQDKKLLAETRRMVNEANKRLRSLEKTGQYNSWASKKLFERLDTNNLKALSKIKKGKQVYKGKFKVKGQRIKTRGQITGIKIPKNATNTQLIAINQATRKFLDSKTSTPRGIKRVKKSTIKTLKSTLSLKLQKEVTEEDAQFYYDMLENKDFNTFNEKIGASRMWEFIDESIERNQTQPDWIDFLENYGLTMEDKEMRNRAKGLYKKYVKPTHKRKTKK